jgi:hypothetical protein
VAAVELTDVTAEVVLHKAFVEGELACIIHEGLSISRCVVKTGS